MTAMAAASGSSMRRRGLLHRRGEAAKVRYPGLRFRQADAEAMPEADGTFDAVAIGFGVHHFPFPVRALVEAHRVLRLGGRSGTRRF